MTESMIKQAERELMEIMLEREKLFKERNKWLNLPEDDKTNVHFLRVNMRTEKYYLYRSGNKETKYLPISGTESDCKRLKEINTALRKMKKEITRKRNIVKAVLAK